MWEVILRLCLLGKNVWPRKRVEKGVMPCCLGKVGGKVGTGLAGVLPLP